MMEKRCVNVLVVVIVGLLGWNAGQVNADELWSTHDGTVTIEWDGSAVGAVELRVDDPRQGSSTVVGEVSVIPLDAAAELLFGIGNAGGVELLTDPIRLHQGITITAGRTEVTVHELVVMDERTAPLDGVYLELRRVKLGFIATPPAFGIYAADVRIPASLAGLLGAPKLAGMRLGDALIGAEGTWIGGDEPAVPDAPLSGDDRSGRAIGPDMIHCQLYGLYQPSGARLGGIAAFSVGTTSWNIGDADLIWFGAPSNLHPFIVMDLFRLKDDRFEQIGQSDIKHGFYALGNTQCGGSCTYDAGHYQGDWLGQGCTDTYTAGLNAIQSGMGPRYEVDPWTGGFTYAGSHYSSGHSHDPIQHRLQVYESDLDPAQNPGATYYSQSYYVCLDDVEVMNSAAWKPVTPSGVPGGTWTFAMSGSSTPPEIGFAIDAWTGVDDISTFAQELPVVEFVSPDGRCRLASKVTDLGGGTWHYEYALLNIDMDRKVGSFSIPLPPGATVTNIGFHAVHSHDEPYSNVPWTDVITADAITWSTVDNPLRWGTLYNFRFDADVEGGRTTATLGLFEPGTPDVVTGGTFGPQAPPPFTAGLQGEGGRYLAAQFAGAADSCALYLTGDTEDAAVACLGKYIDTDGKLVSAPVFQSADLWGSTVYISGIEVIPGTRYSLQIDTGTPGSPVLGPPNFAETWAWGDTTGDGNAAFEDILLSVRAFQLDPGVSVYATDLDPCLPDGEVIFGDILAAVKGFQQTPYTESCAVPCP